MRLMRETRHVFLGLVAAYFLAACGSEPSASEIEVSTTKQPIIGGTTDMGDPAVSIVLIEDGQGNFSTCAGVLVAPKVVLSAGSCTDDLAAAFPVARREVLFATSLGSPLEQSPGFLELHAATLTETAPGFDPKNPQNGKDIGALLLDSPSAIAPLALSAIELSESDVGNSARLVGFGLTSATDNGDSSGKHQVTTTLSAVALSPPTAYFASSTRNYCEGDPGGPAFMTRSGSSEQVVALDAFGATTCGASYATDVGAYGDFIQGFITAHDSTGGSGGTDGVGGNSGTGGAAGTTTGGSSGSAGAGGHGGNGGAIGSGGTGSSNAGAGGSSAGTSGTNGSIGTGGNSAGGAGAAGSPGAGDTSTAGADDMSGSSPGSGTAGVAGADASATGGNAEVGGGNLNVAGSNATAGSAGVSAAGAASAQAGSDGAAPETSSNSGCSCGLARGADSTGRAGSALLLLLLVAARRKRR
jgi:hypothetical protein